MVRAICIRHSTTAGFKLTKLFGIYDFSVEKDSGKVLIIIIYCFYNNNNYYYYYYIIISVNQSAAYFYKQMPRLCGSRKYPYPRQGWSLEIPRGRGGGGG